MPPARMLVVDDSLSADKAYKLACEGTTLLWRGDYHNARQLLQAMARRVDRKPGPAPPPANRSTCTGRRRGGVRRSSPSWCCRWTPTTGCRCAAHPT